MINRNILKIYHSIRNPHFWLIVLISILVLLIYVGWPWREWQLDHGIWRFFPWLSSLYALARFESANHLVGILFFIPIIYTAVLFSWQSALVASLIAVVGIFPIIINMWLPTSLITNELNLLLPLFIIMITSIEMERRRQKKEHQAERERERKTYISKIIESEENERKLISQDLHDDILQKLTAIVYSLNSIESAGFSSPDSVGQKVESIKELTNITIEDTRRICKRLRPSVLDTMGMVPAFRWLIESMNNQTSINTRIIFEGTQRRLPGNLETTLFRVLQEALFNIRRHSNASNAVVTLMFDDNRIKITIQDDGQGFQLTQRLDSLAMEGKLGLVGIKQRINTINGNFEIHSQPGEGTTLSIEVLT
ncbi:MAG: sensor histidine kinase [Dehalococcoidia bacterium]